MCCLDYLILNLILHITECLIEVDKGTLGLMKAHNSSRPNKVVIYFLNGDGHDCI